jgi:hypothetical protein
MTVATQLTRTGDYTQNPPVKPQGQSFQDGKGRFRGVSGVPLGRLTLMKRETAVDGADDPLPHD